MRPAPAPGRVRRRPPAVIAALSLATGAVIAADEIQVYNAEINRPGQITLQLHGNQIVSGRTSAEFPGGMVPEGSFNGTPEFALGVTDFWEVGLYLPYAVTRSGDFEPGGVKLRTLLASPSAHDRRFFYGVNVEVSNQPLVFEGNHWNSEVRPIVGWRRGPIEFILNPIVDVALSGPRRTIEFAPATRLAWIVSSAWAAGLEHYADFGPIDRFNRSSEQLQELFAVADYSGRSLDLDFGIGRGLTSGSDDWTVKVILGWTLRDSARARLRIN